MSSALKNRLVGTIILVALAVIFLPDVLDGRKVSNKDIFVDSPQRPEMKAVSSPNAFPSEEVEQKASREVEVVDELPIDEPASEMQATQPPTSDRPADQDSLQQETIVETGEDRLLESAGWVVQLGGFRNEKNVRELLNKLQAAGYRAFSRPIQTSSGKLTKVFVGPDLQKEKLEKAIPHLNELTNLQGRITPFRVK